VIGANCEKTIVLASASSRRRELLEQIGLKFEVEPSNHIEETNSRLKPRKLAEAMSYEKAMVVAKKRKNAIIIAADTLGVLKGKIIGKPKTNAEAREMLVILSGKSHAVITGFTVLDTDENKVLTKSVETKVRVKKLTSEEIDAYVESGEPLDKAGAYAIQGLGATIIDSIEGDYSNVVGLPLSTLVKSLKEFGVHVL
jgi:septum formation protein